MHTHPDNQAGLIVRDSLLRVRMRKALGGKTWETSHRTYPSDLNSSRDIWRHENRESVTFLPDEASEPPWADRAALKDQGGLDVGNLGTTREARDSDTPSMICSVKGPKGNVRGIFFGRLVVSPVPAR